MPNCRCLCRVIVATPCRECSNVMYCSATCEEKAWGLYHQVGVSLCLSWLQPTWVGRLGHLALRTVLVAGTHSICHIRIFIGRTAINQL